MGPQAVSEDRRSEERGKMGKGDLLQRTSGVPFPIGVQTSREPTWFDLFQRTSVLDAVGG